MEVPEYQIVSNRFVEFVIRSPNNMFSFLIESIPNMIIFSFILIELRTFDVWVQTRSRTGPVSRHAADASGDGFGTKV